MANKNLASEKYVDEKVAETISAKEFTPIESTSGNFMMPVQKTGSTQLYMRLTAYNLDGAYTTLLDGKFYTKLSDGVFQEYNP
jgi:hypothetical protein